MRKQSLFPGWVNVSCSPDRPRARINYLKLCGRGVLFFLSSCSTLYYITDTRISLRVYTECQISLWLEGGSAQISPGEGGLTFGWLWSTVVPPVVSQTRTRKIVACSETENQ